MKTAICQAIAIGASLVVFTFVHAAGLVVERPGNMVVTIQDNGTLTLPGGSIVELSSFAPNTGDLLVEKAGERKMWVVDSRLNVSGLTTSTNAPYPLRIEYESSGFEALIGANGNFVLSRTVCGLADSDNDGIVDAIEQIVGSGIGDPSSFASVALPDTAVVVNESRQQVVTYDYSRYVPDYSQQSAVRLVIPPNAMQTGSLVPIVEILDEPAIAPMPIVDNYTPLGRCFEITGTLRPGASVSMAFALPNRRGFLVPGSVKIMHYNSSGVWQELNPDSVTATAVYATTASFSPFVPMVREAKSAAIYVNNAEVFERRSDGLTGLELDITVNNVKAGTGTPGVSVQFDAGGGKLFKMVPSGTALVCKQPTLWNASPLRVVSITVYTNSSVYASIPVNKSVAVGQRLTITGLWEEDAAGTPTVAAAVKNSMTPRIAYHNINTQMGTEGRVVVGADGKDGGLRFYIKDHLGTTRATVGGDGLAVEKLMYHSYGNVADVGTPVGTEETRERFTGKERDEEGAVTGVTEGDGVGLLWRKIL